MISLRRFNWLLLYLATSFVAAAAATTAPAPKTIEVPAYSKKWLKEIDAFARADAQQFPPTNGIVFVGSSSIRMWKTLAEDFPSESAINRGFGGSQIVDSYVFADRIVIPYKPRMVVFYAGGNDINAGKHPKQLLDEFKQFAKKVHKALPSTRIAYVSIAPNPKRWLQIDRVREANALIADYCAHEKFLLYIDVHTHMLGPDGKPKPDIFIADQLHMNSKGYAIWKDVIGPYLPDQDALSRQPVATVPR